MLTPMRSALRVNAIKRFPTSSPLASTSSLQSSHARGYATCSEDAPEIDPSIFSKKVDMSVIEKGQGHYINYKKLDENIKIVRER